MFHDDSDRMLSCQVKCTCSCAKNTSFQIVLRWCLNGGEEKQTNVPLSHWHIKINVFLVVVVVVVLMCRNWEWAYLLRLASFYISSVLHFASRSFTVDSSYLLFASCSHRNTIYRSTIYFFHPPFNMPSVVSVQINSFHFFCSSPLLLICHVAKSALTLQVDVMCFLTLQPRRVACFLPLLLPTICMPIPCPLLVCVLMHRSWNSLSEQAWLYVFFGICSINTVEYFKNVFRSNFAFFMLFPLFDSSLFMQTHPQVFSYARTHPHK